MPITLISRCWDICTPIHPYIPSILSACAGAITILSGDKWMDGWMMDGWMDDGWMDGRMMDGWMDGCMDEFFSKYVRLRLNDFKKTYVCYII